MASFRRSGELSFHRAFTRAKVPTVDGGRAGGREGSGRVVTWDEVSAGARRTGGSGATATMSGAGVGMSRSLKPIASSSGSPERRRRAIGGVGSVGFAARSRLGDRCEPGLV